MFEIFCPDPDSPAPKSVVKPYSPEWCADIIAAASKVGNVSFMTPVVRLLHYAAAAHRLNGGKTARPDSKDDIVNALRDLRKNEKPERE